MSFKMKRRNWLFAGFIAGICILVLWIIAFFVEYSNATPFDKFMKWALLVFYIYQPIFFYYSYKKELKEDEGTVNNGKA